MITQSETVGKIYPDLVKALSEMVSVKKDAKSFKNKYATLEAVIDTVRPIFARHNLAVTQFPIGGADNIYGVETRIIHVSGEWIGASSSMKVVKDDPQSIGSLISYLKRYQMMGACMMPTADDDGVAASAVKETVPESRKAVVPVEVVEETNQVLKKIGSLTYSLKPELRQKVSKLVFRDKSSTEVKQMPLEALKHALTLMEGYINGGEKHINTSYEEAYAQL